MHVRSNNPTCSQKSKQPSTQYSQFLCIPGFNQPYILQHHSSCSWKKSTCKWTCAVQICVVWVSTVLDIFSVSFLFIIHWGFPGGLDDKESAYNGDLGLIPGWGRPPGEGHGNPFQYSCLENAHGQRSLVGYSPRGCRVGHDWATKHCDF